MIDYKKESKRLQRELDATKGVLERLRKAKAAKIQAAKPRARSCRDIIRVTFGDLHGCKMDRPAVAALLGDIKKLGPDEILGGGDFVDCGGFLAQHHVMGYVAETEYTYEQDIAAANGFLDKLREVAPDASIEMMEGNHENRPERWVITETLRNRRDADYLRRLVGVPTLLHLAKREIKYYERNKMHGDCRQLGFIRKGKCFFAHEIASGKNAAQEALRRVAGNVVFFHTHRSDSAVGFRPGVGDIGAWNPGCLCEPRPMWQHTRPNDWTHGYGIQLIAPSGNFLHINVPIIDGKSLFIPLTTRNGS